MSVNIVHPGLVQALRRVAEAALPEDVEVKRYFPVSDGAGGRRKGTPETVARVKGRRSPAMGGTERISAERLAGRNPCVWTLPALTPVRLDDVLVSDGHTDEVAEILAPQSYEVVRRVLCVEIL